MWGGTKCATLLGLILAFAVSVTAQAAAPGRIRVIEILADKDSRYKMAGQKTPSITVKAGEQIVPVSRRARQNRGIVTVRFTDFHCCAPGIAPGSPTGISC